MPRVFFFFFPGRELKKKWGVKGKGEVSAVMRGSVLLLLVFVCHLHFWAGCASGACACAVFMRKKTGERFGRKTSERKNGGSDTESPGPRPLSLSLSLSFPPRYPSRHILTRRCGKTGGEGGGRHRRTAPPPYPFPLASLTRRPALLVVGRDGRHRKPAQHYRAHAQAELELAVGHGGDVVHGGGVDVVGLLGRKREGWGRGG